MSLKDVTQSGDLLGSVARVPDTVAVGRMTQDTVKLIFKSDLIDKTYLYWVLRSPEYREYCRSRSMGTTNLSMSRDDFLSFSIPQPSETRLLLAQVLDEVEAKIALNRRINQTLEAIAQAIFRSWFVDFDPVKAKIVAKTEGRDPLRATMSAISGRPVDELDALPPEQYGQLADTAALFPDELAQLPPGDAPAGWSVKSFAQLTDKIGSGATPRGGKEVYEDEGVALIRSQNVYDSLFVWDGLARITDEAANQLKGVTVQEGDVLLNITGASILRTCVVLPDALPARVNQHVAIIRAKAGVPPRFLHQHLLLAETKSFLLGLNAGASREAITKGHIESLEVLVPAPELLASFQAITDPLFRRVECGARQIGALAEMRNALLPKLLSGELTVNSAAAAVESLGEN
ncbi:hypothetical protein [Ideonella sp.]|uniref:hypothetical protein n=1 Tax=Ideonella sp. TaxID=1929293 RepID=UPI0035B2ED62